MIELIFYFRWAILLFLLFGATTTVQRTLALKPCFAPIVTFCTIAVVVYLGGIAGLLRPVCYAIILLCAASAIYWARSYYLDFRTCYSLDLWLTLPTIEPLFLVGALCFAFLLRDSQLVHYDNFTHWALVVKEMLITHAFPTADSALIEFTNYPTGTAAWIYFVCSVVGRGENSMILAQALLIFASLYAVFGVIAERGRFLLVVALGTGLCLLSVFNLSIRINTLLVDFVLPVLTLAALSLIYRHHREPERLLLSIIPLLGLLTIVKNNGIFFATIALLYLIYVIFTYQFAHKGVQGFSACAKLWAKVALCVTSCMLPLLLWNVRMHTVFAGVHNKFETNLSQINTAFGGKTQEEVAQICNLFVATLTDVSQRATMGILLFHLLAVLACIVSCCFLKKNWALPKVLLLMDIMLVCYLLGILAMYIYEMPIAEAIYLAAFDRYTSSIVVLYGGVLSICFVIDMEASFYYRLGEVENICSFQSITTKKYYCNGALACVVALVLLFTSEYNGTHTQQKLERNALPNTIKQVVGDNWEKETDDARYLVFISDTNEQVTSYYTHYIARYYLRAHNVDAICLFYPDNFLNLLSRYDYLVILEDSAQAQQLMQQHFGLSGQPGIYRLADIP